MTRYAEMTSKKIAEIRALWVGGMQNIMIGKQVGCSEATVRNYTRDLGNKRNRIIETLTFDDEKKIIELLTELGLSASAIAAKIGKPYHLVRPFVRNLQRSNVDFDCEPVREMRRQSWPIPDTNEWAAMKGQRYEDIDELTLHREWPHPIPLNGERLKFAAFMSQKSYGVTEMA